MVELKRQSDQIKKNNLDWAQCLNDYIHYESMTPSSKKLEPFKRLHNPKELFENGTESDTKSLFARGNNDPKSPVGFLGLNLLGKGPNHFLDSSANEQKILTESRGDQFQNQIGASLPFFGWNQSVSGSSEGSFTFSGTGENSSSSENISQMQMKQKERSFCLTHDKSQGRTEVHQNPAQMKGVFLNALSSKEKAGKSLSALATVSRRDFR